MFNIKEIFSSSKRVRILIIAACFAAVLLIIFLYSKSVAQPDILQVPQQYSEVTDFTTTPTPTLKPIEFEPESKPDSYVETLPDGTQIEYGTRHGPLTPERIEELRNLRN